MSEVAAAYSSTGAAWQAGPALVYDRLAEVLVDAAPVPVQDRLVVDLGAGTGSASRAIADAGGVPLAADLALGMLQALTEPPVAKVVSDARHLPFADESVGGVVAAFSLNHVPDPALALREARRVVASGGPIVASAYASGDTHPVKGAVESAAAEAGWRPAQWVERLRAESMPVLATVAGARHAVEQADLPDAEVRELDVALPHLSGDDLVAWRCGMAQMAPFIASLPPGEQTRLRARARELLGDHPELVRRIIVISAIA